MKTLYLQPWLCRLIGDNCIAVQKWVEEHADGTPVSVLQKAGIITYTRDLRPKETTALSHEQSAVGVLSPYTIDLRATSSDATLLYVAAMSELNEVNVELVDDLVAIRAYGWEKAIQLVDHYDDETERLLSATDEELNALCVLKYITEERVGAVKILRAKRDKQIEAARQIVKLYLDSRL